MNVALGNWRECGFSVTPRRELQGSASSSDLGRSRRVPATMRSKSGAADTVNLQFFVIGEIKHSIGYCGLVNVKSSYGEYVGFRAPAAGLGHHPPSTHR
jgi:hypothetical protein